MDKGIDNIAVVYGENQLKAIDDAVYRNFLARRKGITPFYAVAFNDTKNLMVSDDILEIMDKVIVHPLFSDYVDLGYDHIDNIAEDIDPLAHWAEIEGVFGSMDGEVLRFILHMKIPLEKFIRHELAVRGHDENYNQVGLEKAREVWMK
ncbi:MAG: hypothetical protein Crog4KO_18950 [Crocinitomicaceae bacterium]